MPTQQFEIEIKSLLGEKENADVLREKMREIDPVLTMKSYNKQLNHYFIGDPSGVFDTVSPYIASEHHAKLLHILEKGSGFSIRTRLKDNTLLFVIKASLDDSSSHNGIRRMEFEEKVDELTLDELDQILLKGGLTYQSKWSREREEYELNGIDITIDKNAGYGYLSEFEAVIDDEGKIEEVKAKIHALMNTLGVAELPQDRLERMFAYYNTHWPEYYGTDKVFTIH